MSIFERFKLGFKKSASTFTSGLKEIIVKKEIDDKTLDEIEEFLIKSDVGIIASEEIKKSSILSKVLSSISFFIIISLNPDAKFEALF